MNYMKRKRGYFKNILVGADQAVGTLFGIDADYTISAYVGLNGPKWAEKVINVLFQDPMHCQNSVEDHRNCK
jgi:hypothetical protein